MIQAKDHNPSFRRASNVSMTLIFKYAHYYLIQRVGFETKIQLLKLNLIHRKFISTDRFD